MSRLEQYREQKEKEKLRRETRNKYLSRLAIIFMLVVVLGGGLYYFCFWGAWSYYNGGEDTSLEQDTKAELNLISSETHDFKTYGDLILSCDKNALSAYNAAGEMEWSINYAVKEPIVDVCGKYILIADRGGKSIYIIRNGKIILEYETQYNISNACVNKYGSFVTVTEEENFKNLVCLRDASGKEFFTWHSANSYVMDAAVSDDESTIMLTTMTTQILPDGKREYTSGVKLFDVYAAKEIMSTEYENDIAVSVINSGSGYIVISGKSAVRYDEKGREKNRYDFEGKIGKMAFDEDRFAVVCIDNEYKNTLIVFDSKLKVDAKKTIEHNVDSIDFDTGVISYIADDEIYMCKPNLDVRYRIKAQKLYTDIELFVRGKRAIVANESGAAVIKTK